jgi:broad specificity phosphatase PhoE
VDAHRLVAAVALPRVRQTLADRYGLALALDERLKEVGFGEWEGKSPPRSSRMRLARWRASRPTC